MHDIYTCPLSRCIDTLSTCVHIVHVRDVEVTCTTHVDGSNREVSVYLHTRYVAMWLCTFGIGNKCVLHSIHSTTNKLFHDGQLSELQMCWEVRGREYKVLTWTATQYNVTHSHPSCTSPSQPHPTSSHPTPATYVAHRTQNPPPLPIGLYN